MRVLLLTNEYPPNVYGGAGVHVEYLSRELGKLVELGVRCFGTQNEVFDDLKVLGVSVDAKNLEEVSPKLRALFSALYRNLGFFSTDFRAEVVHCHTWYTHFAGILSKVAYGIPLVVTTHSLEPLRPWKREQLGRGYDFSCWVERQALTLADAVIAVSEETRQDILHHFGIPSEKIHVIPNGIDLREFSPTVEKEAFQKYGVCPGNPYVLFVGRITRQKGIIHLVDSIPFLDKDIQVVLCAGAPDTEEIKLEMEKRVREIQKQRENVVWITETVEKTALIQLYSHAHVFCCPSIYEPFGIINLEAMSCAVPVVGSKLGGIKEIVLDGETGILVPVELKNFPSLEPKDPGKFSIDLAEAINKLFRDKTLRDTMAKKSRKRVEDNYSWKTIAGKVVQVYRSVVENGGKEHPEGKVF